MNLRALLPLLSADSSFAAPIERAAGRGIAEIVATPGIRPALLAELARVRPLAIVTATGREADELQAALAGYLQPHDVAVLPAWETLPHERLSPRPDTVARRLAVLRRLAHPDPAIPAAGELRVVIIPVRALIQPVVAGAAELAPVRLAVGQEADLEEVATQLADAAYTRVDMVERRGEFAVRGGLLDVFPPTESHPLRIEFFGDEVDEIRVFSVADQRSIEAREFVWAPPAREILLSSRVRARAREAIADFPGAREMLEKIADGIAVEGMESLAGLLVDDMHSVVANLDPDSLLIALDPERLARRVDDLLATTDEFLSAAWTSAAAGGTAPLAVRKASFLTLDETRTAAINRSLGWWEVSALASGASEEHVIDAEAAHRYRGRIDELANDLRTWLHEGRRVVITTDGPGPGRRVAEQLGQAGIAAQFSPELADGVDPGTVHVTLGALTEGYLAPGARVVHLAHADLTGRRRDTAAAGQKMPTKRRKTVDPLALKPGDYVVHDTHGVGRFVELITRSVGAGAKKGMREYVVIEYAPSRRGGPADRLFVPTDSLDQVTKYTGGESPSVNRLGGSDWAKTKSKARKAIREIAAELVRLYAVRTSAKGHAFSPDTPWQRELEEAFPYMETPDQLATIEDVKADMERAVPMDRLICGDVGYGKTEIAVRAAFKAVQDGKQVAVLCPTTLLVQQHFETFSERYGGFPVRVAALSRFQSAAEAKRIKDELKAGTIDVVIGTHRLITGEVYFKDLGLVIVDEEQRFGVEHKEALKQLRANVDVLAMSATPIPRTLEMAVTGIREMSTLATPPEERHPVLTYVGRYEEKQIAAAIRRELLRDGQVFFIHNRVESIDKVAARLKELVPEARIGIGHGKMNETQLEKVIVDFWNREFDVLVCTTIVETGLDISNANTLIVDRADAFGLSQLHQLRGRVGRGRDRAYAYFLYHPEKTLTETAYERLRTIAANTDLGAGMQVAMKDLEIRGAGNLLGGEQSGHIAGVGFDLYVRMVAEAVAAFKGEYSGSKDMKLELPVDAHVPEDYIGHERLRLEAYSKIAAARTREDLDAIAAELTDRYGPIPRVVERLFTVAELRESARAIGLEEAIVQGQMLRVGPLQLKDSQQVRLKRLHPGTHIRLATRQVLIPIPKPKGLGERSMSDDDLLAWVRDLFALLTSIIRG